MNDHAANHTAVNLTEQAAELLTEAGKAKADRAARTLISSTIQRGTLIALLSGAELAEHASPRAATLQIISGEVRLVAGERTWSLRSGDLIAIPPQRHSLHADADAVVLLTVAVDRGRIPGGVE